MTESGERRKQFEKWVESQDEAWGNTFRSSEGWMWEAWRAAFEAGRGGWISVAPDSLPEFDRKVLLLIEGTVQTGWRVAMENYKPGFWLWLVAMESPDDEDPTTPFNADQVQGWQPLPAPPDSGDANKK